MHGRSGSVACASTHGALGTIMTGRVGATRRQEVSARPTTAGTATRERQPAGV